MKVFLLIAIAALVAAGAYYVYLGARAYRLEAVDFAPARSASPKHLQPPIETIHWQLPDGARQRAFYMPSRNGAAIVYVHGAPGNAAGFEDDARAMAAFGYGALLVDMPGYGASEGKRDWGSAYRQSVRAGLEFLQQRPEIAADRIAGLGYSMGAHTMARVAVTDDRISALVLLAGFTNLQDHLHVRFQRRVPGMGYFGMAAAAAHGVDVLGMDIEQEVARLDSAPVLVISGTQDHVIPAAMAETLADKAPHGELYLIDGAGHAGFAEIAGDEFYRRIHQFLESAWHAAETTAPTNSRRPNTGEILHGQV
ncbi:MAG: alpha/beta fold hydrolase [Pseudomonadales bacterium]